ncbi:MAG: hypothetical protein V4655_01130 [Bdellovibrionota bacterium]
MKRPWAILLIIALSFSCKKVVVGKGAAGEGAASGVSEAGKAEDAAGEEGESAETEEVSEEELGADGEISPDVEPSVAEESFNLVKFISTRKEPELTEIKTKIDPEFTKLAVGDRSKFGLETNTSMKIDPAASAPAGERKLEARFWVDAYMFDQKVKNIGAGSQSDFFMEAQATATLDKLGMEAFYRYLGVDVSTKTITAGWEPRYTRDNEIKMGANVVIVGAEAKVRMGGEVAVKFEFGVRRDGVLNMIFTPQANITSSISLDAKVLLGLAEAGPEGIIQMMKYVGRGNGNIGFIKKTKMIYADIGMDPGAMTFTDGKIDLVGRSLGREVARKNVYDPVPLKVQKIPQFGTTITKYVAVPTDCEGALAEAEKVLNVAIVKMKAYREAVADEDKPVITTGLNRMNELKVKAKKCS